MSIKIPECAVKVLSPRLDSDTGPGNNSPGEPNVSKGGGGKEQVAMRNLCKGRSHPYLLNVSQASLMKLMSTSGSLV